MQIFPESNASPPQQSPAVFIFDSMRTRSHVLFRFLSTNAKMHPIDVPFLRAGIVGKERWLKGARCCEERRKVIWEPDQPMDAGDTFEMLRKELAEGVEEAALKVCPSEKMLLFALLPSHPASLAKGKQGKIAVSNNHVPNLLRQDILFALHRRSMTFEEAERENPTHIPDAIFSGLTPVVLIRHPILQINSSYRTATAAGFRNVPTDEDFEINVSTHLVRFCFEMFKTQGREPIVVDAEDVLYRTDEVIKGVCEKLNLGLHPSEFSDTWEQAPEKLVGILPVHKHFTGAFLTSAGINRPEGDMVSP